MAPSAVGNHPWPAWFQDSVQHAQLLTNRTLRSYLLAHSAERWPEVVKATLLYGVLCLQREFPGQPVLDVPQLHEASRRLHAEAALNSALPRIRSQFESLEADVGGFLAELDQNSYAGSNAGTRSNVAQARSAQQRQAVTVGSRGPGSSARAADSSVAPRSVHPPSSACGDSTAASAAAPAPPKPRGKAAIYPDWWPKDKDRAAAVVAARRASVGSKARPQPRLAYSQLPTGPPSVTQDDLPTAAFLLVPPRLDSRSAGKGTSGGQAHQAQPKLKLQHAQRLALQRQQQQEQEERPQQGTSLQRGGEHLLERTLASPAALAPISVPAVATDVAGPPAAYDPALVAKWRRHFGLFAVRAPPAGVPAAQQPQELKLEAPLDLDALFDHGSDELDAGDLALLALFSGPANTTPAEPEQAKGLSSSAVPTADASTTVVMGQALCVPGGPQGPALAPAVPMPMPPPVTVPIAAPAAPANPVQQLQLQAVMQHQAAIMQNPQAFPAAAQMYAQQAMMQQQAHQQHLLAAQQQAAAAAAATGAMPQPAVLGCKRGKSMEEAEEQTERIKKRRRESAQRSRQRKNAYMKGLEMENRALKMENERLRMELTKCVGGTSMPPMPKASSGSVSRHESAGATCSGQQDDGSDHVSLSDDEDGVALCDQLGMPTLDGPSADLAHDALALMPSADLPNFAF